MSSSIGGAGGNAPIQGSGGDDKKPSPIGKLEVPGGSHNVEQGADSKSAKEAARKTAEVSSQVEEQVGSGSKSTYTRERDAGHLPLQEGHVKRVKKQIGAQIGASLPKSQSAPDLRHKNSDSSVAGQRSASLSDIGKESPPLEKPSQGTSGKTLKEKVQEKLSDIGKQTTARNAKIKQHTEEVGDKLKSHADMLSGKLEQAGKTAKTFFAGVGGKVKNLGKKPDTGSDGSQSPSSASGMGSSEPEIIYADLDIRPGPRPSTSRDDSSDSEVIYSELKTSGGVDAGGRTESPILKDPLYEDPFKDFAASSAHPEALTNPTKLKQFSQAIEKGLQKIREGVGELAEKMKAKVSHAEGSSSSESAKTQLKAAFEKFRGSLQNVKEVIKQAFGAIKARCSRNQSFASKGSGSELGEELQFIPVLVERGLQGVMGQLRGLEEAVSKLDPESLRDEDLSTIQENMMQYNRSVESMGAKMQQISDFFNDMQDRDE